MNQLMLFRAGLEEVRAVFGGRLVDIASAVALEHIALAAITVCLCSCSPARTTPHSKVATVEVPASPVSIDVEEPRRRPVTGAPAIALSRKGMLLGGARLERSPKLSHISHILGTPNRVQHFDNTIHIYDELGVTVFERPGTGTVVEINAHFDRDINLPYVPMNSFEGHVTLEGITIDRERKMAAIEKIFEELTTGFYMAGGPVLQLNDDMELFFTVDQQGGIQVLHIDFPP